MINHTFALRRRPIISVALMVLHLQLVSLLLSYQGCVNVNVNVNVHAVTAFTFTLTTSSSCSHTTRRPSSSLWHSRTAPLTTTKLSAAISSSSSSSNAAAAAPIPYNNNNNNNNDHPGFEEGEEYYQELTIDVVGNDIDRTVVRVALPSMGRFRNLTRAIEYSVAHDDDDDDDDDDEFDEENGNINRSRNNRSSSLRLKKLFFSLFERRFHNLNDRLPSRPLSSTTAFMRQRMIRDERNNNNNNHLFIIVRRLFAWFHRRMLFGRQRRQQIQRGFRRTDINGKKRHFALLVASMLSGIGGIRPINLSSDAVRVAGFDMDASVYHERIVHTAHHHRVSSYSSSSAYDTMGGASAFLGSLSSNIQQQKYIKRWVAAKSQTDKRQVKREQ